MRTAWHYLYAPSTHFRSREVINVIFLKYAVTPSFFKLKTSSKNYTDPCRYLQRHKPLKRYVPTAKWSKNVLKNVTMVTKMLHVYISVSVQTGL